jgi:hypothetical protein
VLDVLAPRAAIYCWHAHKRCGEIQQVWADLGILDHQQLVWVKPTPFGRRGWFYESWQNGGDAWQRVRVTAEQCPRIEAGFLEEERRELGERWFRQEYQCSFEADVGAVFDAEFVRAALRDCGEPIFGAAPAAAPAPQPSGLYRGNLVDGGRPLF